MSASSSRLFRLAAQIADPECETTSPLGLTAAGTPVWPIFGAEPDDDDDTDDQDDDDDEDDSDDDDDTDDDKGKGKTKKDDSDDSDDDEDDRVSRDLFERQKRRTAAADKRANDAEKALRDLQAGKGKEGDDKSSADLTEAQERVTALSEENSRLRLQNSFLLNNTHTWHDPEEVMALVLKDEAVEVDDDGTVHGVADAIKRIAKKKPYLIKPVSKAKDDTEDDDDDADEDEERRTTRRARRTQRSGGSQNSGKKQRQQDREKILQTYPALNRR